MHPCLTIDEILRNIFGCTKERRTLCAVAQTCRTFNGPATDLIWETLTDLRPVLQLYSSVLGTSGEYENLLVGFALFVFAVKTGTHCLPAVRRFYGSAKS